MSDGYWGDLIRQPWRKRRSTPGPALRPPPRVGPRHDLRRSKFPRLAVRDRGNCTLPQPLSPDRRRRRRRIGNGKIATFRRLLTDQFRCVLLLAIHIDGSHLVPLIEGQWQRGTHKIENAHRRGEDQTLHSGSLCRGDDVCRSHLVCSPADTLRRGLGCQVSDEANAPEKGMCAFFSVPPRSLSGEPWLCVGGT